jgi:hypothetical protein
MYFLTAEESCDREKIPQSMCLPKFEPHSTNECSCSGGKSIKKIKLKLMKEKHNLFTRKNHIVE